MSKQLLNEELRKHPGMEIDGTEVQATCFFCPYAEDKPSSWSFRFLQFQKYHDAHLLIFNAFLEIVWFEEINSLL